MPMDKKCPGSGNLSTPTLEMKQCPQCGHGLELFSDETSALCDHCGFTVYRDVTGCIRWCRYARECLGDARYEEIMKKLG